PLTFRLSNLHTMTGRTQSASTLTPTSTTDPISQIEMNDNTTQTSQVLQNVSLQVPLMKNDQLYPTPSMKDKIPYDVEFDLRLTGCELIQTSGRLLKLPQTAMATGQVLFHRFYYSKSFVKNPMEYYAMASIFLSTKIEECPRRVRDVLNVFHHIKQVRSGKIIKPMSIDENYHIAKNQVIKAERRLLKELGFCVHVKHPHKMILIYLQAMECNQENLSQKAWYVFF
ncbi:cyclin-L1 isoform X3, partial [Brachionus plicatilis]